MSFLSPGRYPIPVILQSESAECGLTCLAMIVAHFGYETDLVSLRNAFPVSSRGTTLNDIVAIAGELHMSARPVAVDLAGLSKLQLPAILHWNFNHFVVLTAVKGDRCVIHDPGAGKRVYTMAQISPHFTGVAIEFTKTEGFQPKREVAATSFMSLAGDKAVFVRPVVQALALAFIIQILSLALPLGLQLAIDNAAVSGDRSLIRVIALAIFGLVIVQGLSWIARGLILSYLGSVLHFRMMGSLFRHLLKLPMSFFEKRNLSDIISRFDSLRSIQRIMSQGFLEAMVDGVFAIVTIIMLFRYNVALTLCVMTGMVIYAIARQFMYSHFYQASEEALIRSAKHQSHFMETVRGMSTVKLFNRQYLREARWQSLVIAAFKSNQEANSLSAWFTTMSTLIAGLIWAAVIWLGATAVVDGEMSVGMVFAFAAWQQQFVTRSILLIEKLFDFRMLKLHRARVADISEAKIEEPDVSSVLNNEPVKGEIVLKNVSFQFYRNGPFVLKELNLTITPGESVAIIGPSGEGKTTLVKIMLGLLEPTSGEVLIDGVPMKKMGLKHYRQYVGAVMQDDALFEGSIGENIAFFDARPDMAKVEHCARMAAIHDDIAGFPMGYQTLIGDMGSALSGGQKQRVILARALYRDPSILFLDEATSHLDGARERIVNSAISELGITRVIIAHRKETIASAGRVLTMRGGKVHSDVVQTVSDSNPSSAPAITPPSANTPDTSPNDANLAETASSVPEATVPADAGAQ